MRVMVIVKASEKSEAGVLPDPELLDKMDKFNEESGEGGDHAGWRWFKANFEGQAGASFRARSRTVIDGPFAETKELVAGFWIWQVRSMDEAVEWLKRCPNPHDEEREIEIRPLFEACGFRRQFHA